MQLFPSDQLSDHITSIIHKDTQLHEKHIDLTVDTIHFLNRAGSLDFGGSEFEPAETQRITPKKKNKNDDYGWWDLSFGRYKVVFNEKLSLGENTFAMIVPHAHARQAGLSADTALVTQNGALNYNFSVPDCGCNIKENARLASLYLLEV